NRLADRRGRVPWRPIVSRKHEPAAAHLLHRAHVALGLLQALLPPGVVLDDPLGEADGAGHAQAAVAQALAQVFKTAAVSLNAQPRVWAVPLEVASSVGFVLNGFPPLERINHRGTEKTEGGRK